MQTLSAPLLALLCLFPAVAAAEEPMSNAAVVSLVQAGLSEGVIIQKIRSSPSNFALDANSLVTLKQAGVGNNVLDAMLNKRASSAASVSTMLEGISGAISAWKQVKTPTVATGTAPPGLPLPAYPSPTVPLDSPAAQPAPVPPMTSAYPSTVPAIPDTVPPPAPAYPPAAPSPSPMPTPYPAYGSATPGYGGPSLSGSYRCFQFEIDGVARGCQYAPPIFLHGDGTYQESGVKGTYVVNGQQLQLSPDGIRGAGQLRNDQIVFEYVDRERTHRLVYTRADDVRPAPGSQVARPGSPCNPNIPKYSQPGCTGTE